MQLERIRNLKRGEPGILDQINEHLLRGFGQFAKQVEIAGRLFLDLSEETREAFKRSPDDVTRRVAQGLERVGLKQLLPELIYADGMAAKYLGRLPIDQQSHYLEHRIPVLLPDGDSRLMTYSELTEQQVRQVFETGSRGQVLTVRDLDAQKAWRAVQIAERDKERRRLAKADEIRRAGRYRVVKGGRHPKFYPDPRKVDQGLTAKDLLQGLDDMGVKVKRI